MSATDQLSSIERLASQEPAARMIDTWFPCAEVDRAVGTPAGSGLSEKALFTWYASRPLAQARAAVLCSLLPDTDPFRALVRRAVEFGDERSIDELRDAIAGQYGDRGPVVLDMFSGRGIIPLEAARFGTSAIGTDLSPVATLAGRLLADFPLRDWSNEPDLPFQAARGSMGSGDDRLEAEERLELLPTQAEPRLLRDVRTVLAVMTGDVVPGVVV